MPNELGKELTGLLGNYKSLKSSLKILVYKPPLANKQITVHFYYPAFSKAKGEVLLSNFVTEITKFLIDFCLPADELIRLKDKYTKKTINKPKYEDCLRSLDKKAKRLFIQASPDADRTGESGELLLFILIEWMLGATQILAKMSLKTSPEMPIHGADAVHCKYIEATDSLYFYFGESKLYKRVSQALREAINSITESLNPDKMKHELDLVCWHIKNLGLSENAQERLRDFLDPFNENSKHPNIIIVCLLSFEFSKYKHLPSDRAEEKFRQEAKKFLDKKYPQIQEKIKAIGITKPIEIFFLPLPSVDKFRELFQDEIGRRNP